MSAASAPADRAYFALSIASRVLLLPALIDHRVNDVSLLRLAQRRVFPGRPDGDEGINPPFDLEIHEAPQGIVVDRPVLSERSDQSRRSSLELLEFRHRAPPFHSFRSAPAQTAQTQEPVRRIPGVTA
jgi:hypothetical protein